MTISLEEAKIYLSLLIEEYRTLREEIKQASANMFSAFQWGSAILGVVISAGFTQWGKQHAVVLVVFYVLVPCISGMTLFIWLGEATRFIRAGKYLCIIEQKTGLIFDELTCYSSINEKWMVLQKALEANLGMQHTEVSMGDPLVWEQWLRDVKGKSVTEGHLPLLYMIRFAFFPSLMFLSIALATYYVSIHQGITPSFLKALFGYIPNNEVKVTILMVLSIILFVFCVGFGVLIGTRLNKKSRTTYRIMNYLRKD